MDFLNFICTCKGEQPHTKQNSPTPRHSFPTRMPQAATFGLGKTQCQWGQHELEIKVYCLLSAPQLKLGDLNWLEASWYESSLKKGSVFLYFVHKWNNITCILLVWLPFTQHYVCEIHLYCSCSLLYGIACFVYLILHGHLGRIFFTFELLPLVLLEHPRICLLVTIRTHLCCRHT